MKSCFQFLSKLSVLCLVLSLGACNHNEDTDPANELNALLEMQFEIDTYEPIVTNSGVELKGEVIKTLPNHSIKYGFMWMLDVDCPEDHQRGFLEVSEAVFTGKYELMTIDLPKGVDLRVCAFLISSSDARIRWAGDEFKLKL